MMQSKWSNIEVKKLFQTVEKYKNENKSLLDAFKEFAKKSNRKPNSVRNYYYLEIRELSQNIERQKKLGIDLSNHKVNFSDKFSEEETKNLIKEILRQKCMGVSVRKSCLNLADGDLSKMVRFQNKFRNISATNRKLYEQCLSELKSEGLGIKSEKRNVVYMKPQERKLSDEDVNSLFLGLINLVKKTAIENVEKSLVSETEFANTTLRQTLSKLSQAEKTVSTLSSELSSLQIENKKIREENILLKTKIAKFMSQQIVKTNKNKSLVKYLREMKASGNNIWTKI
ncbi:MAG: hypothetical protein ACI4L1_03460 [Christensenellales bacterium]